MGTSTSASTPGHHRPSRLTRPTRVPRPSQRSEALPEEPELQRGLSNRHLQLIAIGGAIGTGMFMGSSSTIHLAGPSIILVYTVIGVFMYFMMRALGEMLLSNLKYKSFRDIAEDMLGPWAGFISGWTYWFSWIVAAMGDMAAITGYAQYWWPNIARWVPATVLVLVLLLLNIIAVKFFGEAEFWFALIKLVAIAILLLVAIWLVATKFVSPSGEMATVSNLWNDGGFFPNGINGSPSSPSWGSNLSVLLPPRRRIPPRHCRRPSTPSRCDWPCSTCWPWLPSCVWFRGAASCRASAPSSLSSAWRGSPLLLAS